MDENEILNKIEEIKIKNLENLRMSKRVSAASIKKVEFED